MKNKQIIFNVELARPTKVKQGIPPTVFTNDTNIVEFIFNVTDLEVPETATAEVNIFMRDGSFFQKDALVEGSEIRYTLSDTEGKHAGMAQIQMTLSYENKRYSTNIFQFKIDSGLNDKVAVEVLIQDWDTITTEARQYLEQMADYGTEFSEIIAEAQTQVNANVVEGAVENKFNALEAEYAQDITSLKQSDISLTAQLQQTEQSLNAKLAENAKAFKFVYPETFIIPEEFKVNLIRRGFEYVTDFDIRSKKIVNGGKTYYVSPTGADSNNGLTSRTPLKNISTALNKADVETIKMMDGVYFINENTDGVLTINKSVNLIGEGNPKFVLGNKYTWLKTDGFTNVYEISRTTMNKILDLRVKDEYGDYVELTKVNTIQSVDETPHSYYFDGSKIYVRSFDDKAPDFTFMVYLQSQALSLFVTDAVGLTQIKLYMENIEVLGADTTMVLTTQANQSTDNYFYALNCKFGYSHSGNALRGLGGRYFLVNCTATNAHLDGFNYHINGVKLPYALEINCVGRSNGYETTGKINNGTTMHDGGKIIRVNGHYYNNQGGNVADINVGTQAINLNCNAHGSRTEDVGYNSNFTAHADAELWVYDCISYGSINDFKIEKNAKIYSKNNALFVGQNNLEASGQLIDFD